MKKVFVTGSSGLLGTNLIEELLDNDFVVKGLVRDPQNYSGKKSPELELIRGSIMEELDAKMEGCDFVIHLAAETAQNIPDYNHYHKINVEGTMNVLEATLKNGIRKLVYVSTANTVSEDPSEEMKFPFTRSFYAQSKLGAEKALLEKKGELEVVIANPTFMLGAYDSKPTSGKIILMGMDRKFIFHPPGGKNFVHVRDVAKGLISCLEHGINGERYVLAGENLKYRQFFERLTALTNQQSMLIEVPKSLLLLGGYAGDLLLKMGFRTDINSVNMHSLSMNNYYENQKSKEELQIDFQNTDAAIIDSLAYLTKMKNSGLAG
ncbi:NAD-dependent epimerase/dehydratase family protein [Salinimicrobium soli]|uniref:NAD-dependent epimerase/dehydratase family protein n=1 Tax=Salinimicrobium soli TaxID=1254399 RepID=UPI003AAC0F7B